MQQKLCGFWKWHSSNLLLTMQQVHSAIVCHLGKYCFHSILKWCSEKVYLDKHLEEHTLGEILVGKVFKLNLGRREKALSKDR